MQQGLAAWAVFYSPPDAEASCKAPHIHSSTNHDDPTRNFHASSPPGWLRFSHLTRALLFLQACNFSPSLTYRDTHYKNDSLALPLHLLGTHCHHTDVGQLMLPTDPYQIPSAAERSGVRVPEGKVFYVDISPSTWRFGLLFPRHFWSKFTLKRFLSLNKEHIISDEMFYLTWNKYFQSCFQLIQYSISSSFFFSSPDWEKKSIWELHTQPIP